ncbi:RES domain-containing protein [Rhizobium leguminosarum]|uniref:RES domain-containing protein n=1 Tax=Rhizobium leguminosarum TaxID=384 RepID=UPI001C96B218|nr:RES domain-containing protein [Rhizobium leguminosarum]MBY5774919.1 RES domain-containing protein [Rhizobium leguminosarum]
MTFMCPRCFENKGLERRLIEVRPSYEDNKCSFHPTLKGIPVKAVAEIIDEVFRNNYDFGAYNGMTNDFLGDDIHTVLYELTGADLDDVVSALVSQLMEDDNYWPGDGEDAFYREDASYVRSHSAFGGHSRLWDEFCRSIVYGQRFFNDVAKRLLGEIFDGIHLQRTGSSLNPVFEIQPGGTNSSVFRARATDDVEARRAIAADIPAQLGPPPARRRRSGRMNPSGITAFYGAFDMDTCVAELRPSVGSVVVGAQFDVVAPLWVLDTTRFSGPFKEPNLFSKDHMKRTAQWRFMQRFMQEIAQPISPTDEHLDYIPTQAVAEYLLHHHEFHLSGKRHRIEAIIFRSAQHPQGKNIVILGDACAIEATPRLPTSKPGAYGEPIDSLVATIARSTELGKPPRLQVRPGSFNMRRVEGANFQVVAHSDSYGGGEEYDGDPF